MIISNSLGKIIQFEASLAIKPSVAIAYFVIPSDVAESNENSLKKLSLNAPHHKKSMKNEKYSMKKLHQIIVSLPYFDQPDVIFFV